MICPLHLGVTARSTVCSAFVTEYHGITHLSAETEKINRELGVIFIRDKNILPLIAAWLLDNDSHQLVPRRL
jgi:hypothetical protein